MSTTSKTVLGVVVIVIILLGLYFAFAAKTHAPGVDQSGANQAEALPSGSGTSDDSLNQDTAAIDSNMNGLSSDNTSVDQGVNAQAAQ